MPSPATMRSAFSLRPSAMISSPSGVAATASEPSTISTPFFSRLVRHRVDHALAHDAEHALGGIPAMHREHAVLLVAHLAGMGEGRALHRLVVGAELFEDAKPVLVDVDAGAGRAQLRRALVQAHAPALLRQRPRRREARQNRRRLFLRVFLFASLRSDWMAAWPGTVLVAMPGHDADQIGRLT